jgi:hypothetical protein
VAQGCRYGPAYICWLTDEYMRPLETGCLLFSLPCVPLFSFRATLCSHRRRRIASTTAYHRAVPLSYDAATSEFFSKLV